MPTERFYRLTEAKKVAIRNAAAAEFIRVPFEKASINQIIQEAGISRGSFYTYFEDKRDVLSFIFEDMRERAKQCSKESLIRTRGDFWVMMTDLMEFLVACCQNDDILKLLENTMPFHKDIGLCPPLSVEENQKREDSEVLVWLYEHTDKTNMQITNRKDYMIFAEMALANLMIGCNQYYEEAGDAEEVKHAFHKRMEILRYGITKDSIA